MNWRNLGLILILSAGFGMFVWCLVNAAAEADRNRPKLWDMEEVVVDGCSYLSSKSYGGYYTLTHKGNCTNEIHKVRSN